MIQHSQKIYHKKAESAQKESDILKIYKPSSSKDHYKISNVQIPTQRFDYRLPSKNKKKDHVKINNFPTAIRKKSDGTVNAIVVPENAKSGLSNLKSDSKIKSILKLIYDMIPFIGDGTEIIVQLVNKLKGKKVDRIILALSVIGLILDFVSVSTTVTFSPTALGVRALKAIYKISKKGAKVLSQIISQILVKPGSSLINSIVSMVRNPRIARAKFIELKNVVGISIQIFRIGGIGGVKNIDKITKAYAKKTGIPTREALSNIQLILARAKKADVNLADFIKDCKNVIDIDGFEILFKRFLEVSKKRTEGFKGVYNELKRGAFFKRKNIPTKNMKFPSKNVKIDPSSSDGFKYVEGKPPGSIDVDFVVKVKGYQFIEDIKTSFKVNDDVKRAARNVCKLARAANNAKNVNMVSIGRVVFQEMYNQKNPRHREAVRIIQQRGAVVIDATGKEVPLEISKEAFEKAKKRCTTRS